MTLTGRVPSLKIAVVHAGDDSRLLVPFRQTHWTGTPGLPLGITTSSRPGASGPSPAFFPSLSAPEEAL